MNAGLSPHKQNLLPYRQFGTSSLWNPGELISTPGIWCQPTFDTSQISV